MYLNYPPMKDLLLNEKFRPRNIDEMIILPRIKKIFEKGLQQNVIFYGHFGTGKTSLARILIGKWTKDKPYIEINSSFYTSIDVLRTKIDEFCSIVYMGLDLLSETTKDDIKYVFLDEFERTSIQYQDALKAYIEEYSNKQVRFILNTNHIDKISEGIKSRMILVNFDPQNAEEERFLKRSIYTKAIEICKRENIGINKEQLVRVINGSFPDIRNILNKIQFFSVAGDISEYGLESEELKLKLFEHIHESDNSNEIETYEKIFNFVNDSFGQDNIKSLLKMLGSDYSKWIIANKKTTAIKLFEINNIVATAASQLENSIDPIILGISTIGNIKKIIYS